MTLSRADQKRLDRLAGDGSSVVGIDLAALFRVILDQIQDSPGGADAGSLTESVRGAVTNHARVEHLYGNAPDPWGALTGDALEQLASRHLAARGDGSVWNPGHAFATGKRLNVVPARKGKHGSVGVILYPASERAARGDAEKRRMEVTSLAASLREDGPGLRPLADEHLDALTQSMHDFGWRPEFPVLIDQHGRILDGRHRRAAARRAGKDADEPPPRMIRVESDDEAVGFAILVNLQRGWTRAERNRIDADLQAAGLSVENFGRQLGIAAKRELIRTALLDNPKESHTKIAKQLGVSHTTVGTVCADEVAKLATSCTHGLNGQGARSDRRSSALTPAPEQVERDREFDEQVVRLHEAGMGNAAIATELRVTKSAVHEAYEREGARRGERQVAWQREAVAPDPAAPPVPGQPPSALSREQALEEILKVLMRVSPEDRTWLLSQLPQQS